MILAHNIPDRSGPAYRGIRTLLFQAQYDLQMETVGPLSTAIPAKKPFVYFEEVRKILAVRGKSPAGRVAGAMGADARRTNAGHAKA